MSFFRSPQRPRLSNKGPSKFIVKGKKSETEIVNLDRKPKKKRDKQQQLKLTVIERRAANSDDEPNPHGLLEDCLGGGGDGGYGGDGGNGGGDGGHGGGGHKLGPV